jgi:hypothetical protein
MKKLMKIPLYVPFIGLIASFALLITAGHMPNMALLITGAILLQLSGWILAAQFFLCGVGFLSSQLDTE